MTEDRTILILDRVWRTMNLCGGVLSGIVTIDEINMFNRADDPVTLDEIEALERDGLIEHPYPNVAEAWRLSVEGRRFPQPSTSP